MSREREKVASLLERAETIERPDAGGETPAPRIRELRGVDFCDMRPQLFGHYIVKGLVHPGLAAIIGASGAGKTFFACDLACHVADGRSYRGLRVRQGLVVYAALEGFASGENRFVAWRKHHLEGESRALPLSLTPGPINLRDPADVEAIIAFIKRAEQRLDMAAAAIFIDTLSRAMAGGDENGSEDMTALIAGADAVRAATTACVVLVHHHGKDGSKGARGHSSFRAALDTEIEVTYEEGTHVATVRKQRDLAGGGRYPFKLDVVTLGIDSDGDSVTSCVVVPVDEAPGKRIPSGKNQQQLLGALKEWHRTHPDPVINASDMRTIATTQKLNRQRQFEACAGLEKFGWLESVGAGAYRFLPGSS